MYYSQTDGKKQSVEKTQPPATSAISETDREMIQADKRIVLERLKQSSKSLEIDGQMVIEREKKRKQRVVKYTPVIKKQRWREETCLHQCVEVKHKRQKTKGQDGCAQLACSTHKGDKLNRLLVLLAP